MYFVFMDSTWGLPITLVCFLFAFAIQAAVDVRLVHNPAANSIICSVLVVEFLVVCAGFLAVRLNLACASKKYWLYTAITAVYILGCHLVGVVGAAFNPSLRAVTGQHYMRIVCVTMVVVMLTGLRPPKTWALVATCFIPTLLQPSALYVAGSWEQVYLQDFYILFVLEMLFCIVVLCLTVASSYRAAASSLEAKAVRKDLVAKAFRSQNLLETSMPPLVAHELLLGTPAIDLTRNYESVSIAFISLSDYASLNDAPSETIDWLNTVYAAFDGLVDAYQDRINKIEIVSNTYVVAAGLPVPKAFHHILMACFCADLLDLCESVPGIGRVNVRIGINRCASDLTFGILVQPFLLLPLIMVQ
jgi:hypothetical protein